MRQILLLGLFALVTPAAGAGWVHAQSTVRGLAPFYQSGWGGQIRGGQPILEPSFSTDYSGPFQSSKTEEYPMWDPLPTDENAASTTERRFSGPGDPLRGTSWLNRPWHVGWMVGSLFGDDLVSGTIEQQPSLLGGYRLGKDLDSCWGLEGRFQFAHGEFTDWRNPALSRTSSQQYWDVDFLYYPWGDARWRPYLSLGLGWARFDFRDATNQSIDEVLFTVPVGVGLKYYWQKWLALRLSFTDNVAYANGPLDTMHNLSLTADVEVHFGGRHWSYFPYHGSVHLW